VKTTAKERRLQRARASMKLFDAAHVYGADLTGGVGDQNILADDRVKLAQAALDFIRSRPRGWVPEDER